MKKKVCKMLCAVALVVAVSGCASEKEEEQEEVVQPEPLVIEIPEPCTHGMITVHSKGEIWYQYQGGNIEIKNDGKNGEPIEIEVNIREDGN